MLLRCVRRFPSSTVPFRPTYSLAEYSAGEADPFRALSSFKFKLAAYFVLLAIVPLVAAFWGFTSVAGRSETRQADARLQSSLRGALVVYDERLNTLADAAERL